MNKYVVIPHEQYESFKSFLAGKKDIKIAESKQETLDENKSEKNTGKEFVDSKIINNNNNINSENFLHNTRKETVISQSSNKPQDKAEFTHPLPPPGLPEAGVYTQKNYFSKIIKKKNGRKIQKGSGPNEWIKKWTKKF